MILAQRFLFIVAFAFLASCNLDDDRVGAQVSNPETDTEDQCGYALSDVVEFVDPSCGINLSLFIHSRVLKSGDRETDFESTYTIDDCGKVIQEIHEHFRNDDLSYIAEFKYNSSGKVVKELRNGIIYRYVEWTGNKALVYNKLCEVVGEFLFENDKIVKYDSFINYELGYDSMGNLKFVLDDLSSVKYEFEEYDMNIEAPFYLTNSINILRMELRPFYTYELRTFSKFIHKSEKQNQWQYLDQLYPENDYRILYEFDSLGRVIGIDNPRYFYHENKFSYN